RHCPALAAHRSTAGGDAPHADAPLHAERRSRQRAAAVRRAGQDAQARARRESRRGNAQAAARDRRKTGEIDLNKKSVLIVEDNQLNRELANALLKTAGYQVLTAQDGAEALMVLGREHVDLMLLDIDLPFIDGHNILQAVREKGIEIPAIVVSGLPGEEPEVRALEIGAIDFIRKPVKNSVLLARVARALKA